jgi:hypothetical protein
LHRKNRIIQKRRNKEDLAKTIKEEKDCVSVAPTVKTSTLAVSSLRVLLNVLVACVVGEAMLIHGSEVEDPISPSSSLLQLGVSLLSWDTSRKGAKEKIFANF